MRPPLWWNFGRTHAVLDCPAECLFPLPAALGLLARPLTFTGVQLLQIRWRWCFPEMESLPFLVVCFTFICSFSWKWYFQIKVSIYCCDLQVFPLNLLMCISRSCSIKLHFERDSMQNSKNRTSVLRLLFTVNLCHVNVPKVFPSHISMQYLRGFSTFGCLH